MDWGGAPTDRRQFLRRAGSAAVVLGAGAAAAGCRARGQARSGGSAHPAASTTTTTRQAGTGGGPPNWAALAASLKGTLVLPSSPGYGADAVLYNAVFTPNPAAIAYCASASDVQRCVTFARQHEVALAARSGGHSYGGYSSCPGLVIDLSSLDAVTVAPGASPTEATTATVGAGTKLIDTYTQLGNSGYLLPGGSCPTVGIGGLALGGGIGVFGRAFGLTCDHIESVRLVTADGMLRTCGPGQFEDLYWASRGGGGGNFGIVTSFDFRLHPIPDITLFTLAWPWGAAGDVIGSFLSWIQFTPDELWANCQVYPNRTGGVVKVTGVFAGPVAACASALALLTSAVASAPTDHFVGPENYLPAMLIEAGCENESMAQCSSADTRYPFVAKSSYVGAPLPSNTLSALIATLETFPARIPGGGGGVVFDGYGGAINRVAPGATAFVHRSAIACAQYSVTYPTAPPTAGDVVAAQSWLTDMHAVFAPVSQGSYQNYIDPTLENWAEAYYGANLPRLQHIKARWDPDDLFRFAQSIPLPA